MEFNDVIRQRFSCRKFSEKQVEKEKLNAILEAGRLAPTAKNFQEQHVYVIQSEEMIKKSTWLLAAVMEHQLCL